MCACHDMMHGVTDETRNEADESRRAHFCASVLFDTLLQNTWRVVFQAQEDDDVEQPQHTLRGEHLGEVKQYMSFGNQYPIGTEQSTVFEALGLLDSRYCCYKIAASTPAPPLISRFAFLLNET